MKIAITGGNGGLGRSLVPTLLDQGHEVTSIDLSLPSKSFPRPTPSANYLIANVTDFGELVSSVQGCDAIIHLAAHISPMRSPHPVVYSENTTGSYNVLYAAAILGIKRVCLASSINAIGGVYSRTPRYDYFPVDEQHPTYAEDPYSMSKWALEQQGDAFARRYEEMSIASLRFHWLLDKRERAVKHAQAFSLGTIRHLWAYTLFSAANRACLLSLTADFKGHEVFYIVGPRTCVREPSLDLARQHFPNTLIRGDLSGNSGFFDCSKAERILGWRHED
jgi:UDP-glucose 4-epimerase